MWSPRQWAYASIMVSKTSWPSHSLWSLNERTHMSHVKPLPHQKKNPRHTCNVPRPDQEKWIIDWERDGSQNLAAVPTLVWSVGFSLPRPVQLLSFNHEASWKLRSWREMWWPTTKWWGRSSSVSMRCTLQSGPRVFPLLVTLKFLSWTFGIQLCSPDQLISSYMYDQYFCKEQ